MTICIPVMKDQGLKSALSSHFGSAPLFMIVDTESGSCRAVRNENQHHGHGMCMPLQSLAGEQLDGVVVGGIGRGALVKLRAAGLRVFLAQHETVEEAVAALKAGTLRTVTPATACGQHGRRQHVAGQQGPGLGRQGGGRGGEGARGCGPNSG
ncbi:MAG: NifB/NifX family molybdenum-iron cluster-binding protein [Planctomycetota bacterium]